MVSSPSQVPASFSNKRWPADGFGMSIGFSMGIISCTLNVRLELRLNDLDRLVELRAEHKLVLQRTNWPDPGLDVDKRSHETSCKS